MLIIYFTLSTIIQMTRIQIYTISYNPFIQDKVMNTDIKYQRKFLKESNLIFVNDTYVYQS
jgi:hypothetical protein